MEQMTMLNQYDIDKSKFTELLSKLTGISKKKIGTFLEKNPVSMIFEHPASMELSPSQINKINSLRELKGLYSNLKSSEKVYKITCPEDIGNYFKEIFSGIKDKEYFACAFLDNGNRIISSKIIQEGTVNMASVFPREIAKTALLYDAKSVIISHNHPGGSLSPSSAARDITKSISRALESLDVKVLDHIIIADNNYMSFAERKIPLSDVRENITNYNVSEKVSERNPFNTELADPFENTEKFEMQLIERKNYLIDILLNNDALKLSNNQSKDFVIFHPSVKDGKYQLTYFVNNEPFSDAQFNTISEVAEYLLEGNFAFIVDSKPKELKNIKRDIVEKYKNEFPAIKHISEETAKKINILNNKESTTLSIKDIKNIYKKLGKKLEIGVDEHNIYEFKEVESIVNDLRKAQLKEKAILNKEKNLQKEMTVMEKSKNFYLLEN